MGDFLRFILHGYLWIAIGVFVAMVQGVNLYTRRRAVAALRRQQVHRGDLPEPIVNYNLHLALLGSFVVALHVVALLFVDFKAPADKSTAFLVWLLTDVWFFGYGFAITFLIAVFVVSLFEEREAKSLPATAGPPVPTPEPTPAPFAIPDKLRMEHALVLGGTGSGKTSLLADWIAKDLHKPCSLIVFDSQGDLINNILKADFPRERVVLIDPTDVRHPIALSLFDFAGQGTTQYDREKNYNSVVELLLFVLSSLDSDVTAKQELTLRMLIRFCLVIPDATIHTLRDVLSEEGFKRHAPHLEHLSETGQAFFRQEYLTKSFGETREQIARRVYSILESAPLERMFSSPTSKIDMREILDTGSVVLINTAKSFLKEQGSAFFARFMTAVIFQAIQEREVRANNMEVFMFIDEAAPVISSQTATILETARKYKLGLTLAFQSLGQIPSDLEHSIISNTSIKAVCGISAKDARALADDMRTKADVLMQTRPLTFYTYAKGYGSALIPVEPGALDRLPRRSDLRQLLEENRAKYAHEPRKPRQPDPRPTSPSDDIEAFNKA